MNADLKKIRGENMDLLRWQHGGNNRLQDALHDSLLPNYVSDWALRKRSLSDSTARLIEKKLGRPSNWFDRDNLKLLNLSQEDYDTVLLLLSSSPEEKAAVRTLLPKHCLLGDVRRDGAPQLRVVKV